MPSSITILCQIKSKGLDGGFVNGLARYMVEPKVFKSFRYGFYKKQVSIFLQDLQVNDYALICGKCVFDNDNMHILISAAFKIEDSGPYNEIQFPPSVPHISFAGKIYARPEEQENDCKFGVYLIEYNNFNFGNKEKMTFKMQVVYDSGPNSRFRRLAYKLEIGKIVFITGFLDLNEDDLPFIEAKEIDLVDEFTSSDQNTTSQSPFLRTNKFRKNKDVIIKKEKEQISNNSNNITNKKKDEDEDEDEDINKNENQDKNQDKINDESETDDEKNSKLKNYGGKKKRELMDLSSQRLKRGRTSAYKKDNDEIDDDQVNNDEEEHNKEIINLERKKTLRKQVGRKKK